MNYSIIYFDGKPTYACSINYTQLLNLWELFGTKCYLLDHYLNFDHNDPEFTRIYSIQEFLSKVFQDYQLFGGEKSNPQKELNLES